MVGLVYGNVCRHSHSKRRKCKTYISHWFLVLLKSSRLHVSSALIRTQGLRTLSMLLVLPSVLLFPCSQLFFLIYEQQSAFQAKQFFFSCFLPIEVQDSKAFFFFFTDLFSFYPNWQCFYQDNFIKNVFLSYKSY